MRIGKRTGGFLLILFFVISMQGKDIGLELVCNGSPNAVIILGEKPTSAAQMGVYELRHHIQLITGVTLPIRRVKADAAVKIYIGDSSAARSAGLKPELCSGETYQLKTVGNNIYLIGCDSPDYGTVDYSRYETFPKNYFATCGSLHAVYDFLEHQCGVLFCGPWENSTAFQKQKNLSISPVNKKFTPPLDAFRGLYTDDSCRLPNGNAACGNFAGVCPNLRKGHA